MPANYKAKKAYTAAGSLTPEKKAKFLEVIATGLSMAGAARAAGVSHTTVYEKKKVDPAFAKAIESAREAGSDRMEDTLLSIGVRDKNVTSLIFLLKGRRPYLYRDNLAVTGPDGGPLQMSHRIERIERVIVDAVTGETVAHDASRTIEHAQD